MIAAVDFANPILWAVLIGWIMSVVLHEFAHGVVAHWGGDYTIRERGGLTLNPLHYVDPMMSIILPTVFLLMGGIPLPGGSTFIRRDLLRNRWWEAAVSLAGPAMNLILCILCLIALHPAVGWVNYSLLPRSWNNGQVFLAAMAVLQFIAMFLNLVPVPPLDGFQALSPFMKEETRLKLSTPPLSTVLFIGFFIAIWKVPGFMRLIIDAFVRLLQVMGFGLWETASVIGALKMGLYGE